MKKYRFLTLTDIMKVKVGTKYVWEDRVRRQAMLVHLLEEIYGVRLNLQAFSFYPNLAYLGMPLSIDAGYREQTKPLWREIEAVLERNQWQTYAADEHIDLSRKPHSPFKAFEEIGYARLLLSEVVLMDLNRPSHGVGRQVELSLLQPLIGFSQKPVSGMVLRRPGSVVFTYKDRADLLTTIEKIVKRKSYAEEPFYIRKCAKHPQQAVFKGSRCMNCYLNKKLL